MGFKVTENIPTKIPSIKTHYGKKKKNTLWEKNLYTHVLLIKPEPLDQK